MFGKTILFTIEKGDVTTIVDKLSDYKCGVLFERTELNIQSSGVDDSLYEVCIKVNNKYVQDCLTDLMTLGREGLFIDKLLVL